MTIVTFPGAASRGPGRRSAGSLSLGLTLILWLCCGPLQGQIAPAVQVDLPSPVFIGETFTFRVTVSPHPTVTGFGPFLEIYLPYQGPDCTADSERCDGISFVRAEAVFEGTRESLPPCPAGPPFVSGTFCGSTQCLGTTAAPPTSCFFGLPLPFCLQYPVPPPTGYQKVVLELPIGSFVPGQAPIVVEVTARVDSYTDPGLPSIYVRGGFRFGTSAQGSAPMADLQCPMAGGAVIPTVATVKKSYLGPENETATGPNFPREYKITVDIADQQTLDPFKIVDCLPDNVTLEGVLTPPGCSKANVFILECPGQGFEVDCTPVTGTAAPVDIEITVQFFVPELDRDGQPVLGPSCTATSVNDVKLIGTWLPTDPRDTDPFPFTFDDTPADHTLTDRCLALQKKWALKPGFDLGAPGPTPGDTIVYTLDFQVSDFRTLRNLTVQDFLSDGQSFIPGSAKLDIFDKFGVVTGAFTPADHVISPVDETYECADGSRMVKPRLLMFLVSQRLASLHPSEPRHAQGILTGGLAGQPDGGATTGRITFEAKIDDEFQRQDPALEPFVDKDDVLRNCVAVVSEVLANAHAPAVPSQVVGSASDTSQQAFPIVHGTVRKTVYAINGSTSFPQPVRVNPGDDVTFRIEYSIPSGDAEDFFIEDYLPLPVFRSDKLKLAACLAPPPPAETVTVTGPLCSVPTLTVKPPGQIPANSFKLSFGDLDDPANVPAQVDVYVTTKVTTDPFADGLVLSNHVRQHEQNTFGDVFEQTEIVPVIVGEPKLRIRKGVVSSNKAGTAYTPAPPAPCGVKFTAPGKSGPAFTGVLTSSNVGTALNSDVSQVDGCDVVKFAIVVENLGSSTKGAFDVQISDVLPPCLKNPTNFRVVNGKGKPFTCNKGKNCGTLLSSFLGAAGITLDDGVQGALAPYSPNGGDNLAIITFDAQVPCNTQTTGCCNNVAKILRYAGVEGGSNHVPANLSTPFPAASLPCVPNTVTPATQKAFEENAQVCVRPRLKKSILATSETATGSGGGVEHLAVGEIIRYCLQVALPEGVSPKMVISDQLPPGLEWLPGTTCRAGMQDPKAQPCTIGPKDPKVAFGVANPQPVLQGGKLQVSLGTVENKHNDLADETFVITCNALVQNAPVNVKPAQKPNVFTVRMTPSSGSPVTLTSNTVLADIVEPMGGLTKEEVPVCVPGGARYSLRYTNTGTAPAFDLRLTDTLPAGVTVSGPVVPGLAGCAVVSAGPSLVNIACPRVNPGQTVGVEFEAKGVQLCQPYDNNASLVYSSLPGLKGSFPNPTGSQTPGASGALKGERVYPSAAHLTTRHCPDLKISQTIAGPLTGPSWVVHITVTNPGSSPAYPPIKVEDRLPPYLSFVQGGGNGWSCSGSASVPLVTCTTQNAIPPGGSSTFTIDVNLGDGVAVQDNCAKVFACEDTDPQNNEQCVIGLPE